MFSYDGMHLINRKESSFKYGEATRKDYQFENMLLKSQDFLSARDPTMTESLWLMARAEYSRRNLSYAGDKLIAISAVASGLGFSMRSDYLAGLWKCNLVTELQWRRQDGVAAADRYNQYVAPSWSWASINGEIEDFFLGDEEEDSLQQEMIYILVSCNVELADPSFEYGAVKSGTLVVKTKIHSFFWKPPMESDAITGEDWDGFLSIVDEGGVYPEQMVGKVRLDAKEPELEEGSQITCIAMSLVERIPSQNRVEGLALLPVNEEEGIWRRVGYCFEVSPLVYEGLERTTVTIV
jgi:hypothetical protein